MDDDNTSADSEGNIRSALDGTDPIDGVKPRTIRGVPGFTTSDEGGALDLRDTLDGIARRGDTPGVGAVRTRSVVGPGDERTEVVAPLGRPNKAVCHLAVHMPNGKVLTGTGWFISDRTIATAAHNIFNNGHGGAAQRIVVSAGRTRSSFLWRGEATGIGVPSAWRAGSTALRHDYAAVHVPAGAGSSVGVYRMKTVDKPVFETGSWTLLGYPLSTRFASGAQVKSVGKIIDTGQSGVAHLMDTEVGNSGGAIYGLDSAGRPVAVAIHRMGSSGYNIARRLTNSVRSQLRAWAANPDA